MEVSAVINQMIVIFILLLVGLLCAKLGMIDDAFKQKLTFVIINVTQVAAILGAAMEMDADIGAGRLLGIVGISLGMHLLLYGLSFVYNFLLRIRKEERGTYQFLATMGNLAFMGFPIVSALLGSEGLFYNSLFNIPLYLLSYSLGMIMITGKSIRNMSVGSMLKSPPLIAAIAAAVIVLTGIRFPAPVVTATTTLGGMTTAGAMLIIGASLSQMTLKEILGDWKVYVFSLIRLISGPVVVWAILRLFVDDPMLIAVAVVLAAMPSGTNATMMALQFGGQEKVASRGVFISTIFSLVTIPLIVFLLL